MYIFSFFFPPERAAWGGGLPDFFFSFFPCPTDHERDWPPCKVVFFGLANNTLNVRNNNNGTKVRNSECPMSYIHLHICIRALCV